MPTETQLLVNGRNIRVPDAEGRTLLSVLRDDAGLTGAKYGCGEGECGACTVLVDGLPTRSCRREIGSLGSKAITTIEGLAKNGKLHPLQLAFIEAGAMQCGYCTCGMIMSGVALLRKNPEPTLSEIVRAMEGNICRCGTYPRIIAALQTAGRAMKESGE